MIYISKTSEDSVWRQNILRQKIDNTQRNCKYRLSGKRDETYNCMTSACSQQAQKEYKTRHELVWKETPDNSARN